MEIRAPNKTNYEAIVAVVEAALNLKLGISLLTDRVFYDADYDPNLCLMAREKGEILGYLAALRRKEQAFVKLIAVAPRRQRQGLGKQMLQRVEERLRGEGAKKISIGWAAPRDFFPGVPARYEAAHIFFKAMGYKESRQTWTASLSPQGNGGANFTPGVWADYKTLVQAEGSVWQDAVEEAFASKSPQAVAAQLKKGPALLLARPGKLGPLFYEGPNDDAKLKGLVGAGAALATQRGPAGLRDERPLLWWEQHLEIAAAGNCRVYEKQFTT